MDQAVTAIELRRFNRPTKMVLIADKEPVMYQFAFGVYFNERKNNRMFYEDENCREIITNWLTENCQGKSLINSSYVFFETYEDALMCRMAF